VARLSRDGGIQTPRNNICIINQIIIFLTSQDNTMKIFNK